MGKIKKEEAYFEFSWGTVEPLGELFDEADKEEIHLYELLDKKNSLMEIELKGNIPKRTWGKIYKMLLKDNVKNI